MENFKNEIRSMLEEIIAICEDNDIEFQYATLNDIALEGAGSFCFHNDIECDDLPNDLVTIADDIFDMFWKKIPDYDDRVDVMDEIVNSII